MPNNSARLLKGKKMTKAENYEILGRCSMQYAKNESVSKLFDDGELIELEFADGSSLNVQTWSEVAEESSN
jgi:hypothetical protein